MYISKGLHLDAPWSQEWSLQGCIQARTVGGRPKQAKIGPIFWKGLDHPSNSLSSLFYDLGGGVVFHHNLFGLTFVLYW